MKPTKLLIFTVDFPYGDYEISFLPQEIEALSGAFEQIFIVPMNGIGRKQKIDLPSNTRILSYHNDGVIQNGFLFFLLAMRMTLREVLKRKTFTQIVNFRYHLSEMRKFYSSASQLHAFLKKNDLTGPGTLYYSYWTDEWASILSLVREEKEKDMLIVSRAHGFDLYDERSLHGYIFPRYLQIRNISRIYTVSKNGCEYLRKKFSKYHSRINCARLGTADPREINIQFSQPERLRIVSCSSVIKLKRVHKIVEILEKCKMDVEWVHFGDGELMEDVRRRAKSLPRNIDMHFRGNTSNEEVHKFYSRNHVDWFVNVSEYEGIPVSMMEAISYGIPLIGTNVGGVSEIVTPATGLLIDRDFDPESIALKIQQTVFGVDAREGIREFWRKNFSAKVNYGQFATELINIVHDHS
jgi:glycosyltransferase involved in cell wall biosynthesis